MDHEDDDRVAAKTLILTLCAAKAAVVGIVLLVAHDGPGITFVLISTWYWIFPAAVVLGGPVLYRYRLRRVRARRAKLIRAEWMDGGERPTTTTNPQTVNR
jgi:hypothetical protein